MKLIHLFIYVTSHLSNDFCQARIAHDQPAARGDAIGLVLELLWVQIIKVIKPEDKRLFFRKDIYQRDM